MKKPWVLIRVPNMDPNIFISLSKSPPIAANRTEQLHLMLTIEGFVAVLHGVSVACWRCPTQP